uniref:O-acetyl-ADP-ribose deacetylase MACROD2 n=1 Tax=Junco hyemalis TaxID=40217 RepID=A0A8C5JD34_JUNHY
MYPGNKRKKLWREEKERLLKMTLEERRKEYLGDYVALKTIPTWMEDLKSKSESDGENTKDDLQGKKSLSEKVSLYRGDITLLEVDAIVNAAGCCLGQRSLCPSRFLLCKNGKVLTRSLQSTPT